jgi:F0F1-type ATP synthase membrane subunit a
MWVWSSDALSLFVSKRHSNWKERVGSLQLLALFDTNNEIASEDQTQIRRWTIPYNYSVVMWVASSDVLSLFMSKRANNWRDRLNSLQLLALFDTINEIAAKHQTHKRKRTIVYNYSVVMWVCSSDALSLFLSKRANNWKERFNSLQLSALFDLNNESASEDQIFMTTE